MKLMIAVAVAASAAAAGMGPAGAQQGTPPRFAPPNLEPAGVRALAANCAPCHGPGGRPASGSDAKPLAGRPAADFERSMAGFKRGERPGTVMPQIAKGYGDDEIAALASWFSKAAP